MCADQKRFGKEELKCLYTKAEMFVHDGGMNTAICLYRNKHEGYFGHIRDKNNGIMPLALKDFCGDPRNPINEKLNGVFFCANVDNFTKKPPSSSPYGSHRFLVPLQALLENLGEWDIYFADFYCMEAYTTGQHYVTLVLCEIDSIPGVFCKSNLIPLPKYNPFFEIYDDGVSFNVSSKVWIEIFYTKEIDIAKMCESKGASIQPIAGPSGNASSSGIPKCTCCSVCGL